MSTNETVLGVVLLTRHGDRQGFYQSPVTYTASSTSITPLGELQEFNLGGLIRSLYFDANSTSYIKGISSSASLFSQSQAILQADAGGEGGVIFDSAIALAQGLWPVTKNNNVTLADGTSVVSPLGGYQYIPVESVEPDEDVSLEGWTSCNKFDAATNAFYSSDGFKKTADDNADFLANLTSIVNGRAVSLQNMWNIFDYMNVQSIHNATFAASCPPSTLARVRALANYHEFSIFGSNNLSSIQNIPGRSILPTILDSLTRISNSSDPLKFASISISYKPFISLFYMTGLSQRHPEFSGIVNYAASVALELRGDPSNPTVRFAFKNGTDDAAYNVYPLFNSSGDIPLSQFASNLSPYALPTLSSWCNACGNNATRGCDVIAAANASSHITHHHQAVSPVAAGFIGAGVTLAVVIAALLLAVLLGLLSLGSRGKGRHAAKDHSDVGSNEKGH